ncbi:MAG TPA: prephenate dehydratase [Candidatus Omnitrophota bacterium]|jgi:chorismate mutase/prephenate dehydratase|nr:prephenate dehydratase [Candidatus Omnitrophota bacterium]
MSLKALRKKIDCLDGKIVELLNNRTKLILNIAKEKSKSGKCAYVPERESDVLRKISKNASGPLDKEGLKAIYREIMSSSLKLEKPLRIAYMGPVASFSNLAAMKKFGSQVEYIACSNIADVFLEVEKELADYGVVPVENSIEGAVTHTLDVLVDSDLKICSQVILNIEHNLLSNSAKNKIKKIYSNPQVFGQCRRWLQDNLPQAELIEVSSTTRAAQIAAKEKNSACIASLLAAKVYRLKVVFSNIEDSPHNITRFFVIGKNDAGRTGDDRTSILFSIKDKVGALHEMLIPFKKNKINLTKIESRPSKKRAWDYYFFVDLAGHRDEPGIRRALLELENKCKFLKVLGSYPAGE